MTIMIMTNYLSYEEMCYTSLVTVYKPHVEEECQEDYVKVGQCHDSDSDTMDLINPQLNKLTPIF